MSFRKHNTHLPTQENNGHHWLGNMIVIINLNCKLEYSIKIIHLLRAIKK